MNIEDFYSADERRRDSGRNRAGKRMARQGGGAYELSWVVDTGELYTMLEPNGGLYQIRSATYMRVGKGPMI